MFRVGATGFGGPLVTMSLMRDAYVRRRNWLSEKEFLERMGMLKLLPGPISSLMAIALGRKFFGVWGSFLALIFYILPAFLIIMLWNFLEVFIAEMIPPTMALTLVWFFKFYIVYLILKASYKLMRDAWANFPVTQQWRALIFTSIMLASLTFAVYERMEIEMLAFAVLLGVSFYKLVPQRARLYSFTALGVFVLFFVASLVVFGTGYMLFPYIDRELVKTGLLSRDAFNTGILLGNLSPGPVVIGATYYGWKLAGFAGAAAATLGIFFGPFVMMNVLYKGMERLRTKVIVQYISLCMIPAVVVVLLKFNWTLIHSQSAEALRLFSMLKEYF
ncbi:MAG: chromate transporter [Bdellovibrionota bacterium]